VGSCCKLYLLYISLAFLFVCLLCTGPSFRQRYEAREDETKGGDVADHENVEPQDTLLVRVCTCTRTQHTHSRTCILTHRYFESFGNLVPGQTLPSEDDFSGNPTNTDGAFLEVVGFSDIVFTVNKASTTNMQYVKVEIAENWELVADLSKDGIEGTCLKVVEISLARRVLSGILLLIGSYGVVLSVLVTSKTTCDSFCIRSGVNTEAERDYTDNMAMELGEGTKSASCSNPTTTTAIPRSE
jgi:hypothetical protein